jgi:predicted dehydrogenase
MTMDYKKIRWGIFGTGRIAGKFAEGLAVLPDAELVAVGSRTQAAADDFAKRFNVPRRHASYAALAADGAVDALYVATPHSLHAENALMGLDAGKSVLCEKPFAINAREAEKMIKRARKKKLLLMEAMWTRFLPPMVRLREMLAAETIGEVRTLFADFGFRRETTEGRLFDLALGGGALLDVGIYQVSLASMLFGKPSKITGLADLREKSVDGQSAVLLGHPGGKLAVLHCAVRVNTPQTVCICGTLGRINLHTGWWKGAAMTLQLDAGGEEFLEYPFTGNGYQFEAIEFMECLRAGRTESAVMPLDETLAVMRTLDTLRAQWGLKYPMEK